MNIEKISWRFLKEFQARNIKLTAVERLEIKLLNIFHKSTLKALRFFTELSEKLNMSAAEKFLHDFQSRPLQFLVAGLKPKKLILGKGHQPLEVAVLTSNNEPTIATIKGAQKKRKNHRASPVLLTVIHDESQAFLCGVSGDNPPVYKRVQLELVEKFCRTALKQPDRHRALKFCSRFLSSIEEGLFGINNKGMLSSHHLIHGVKNRSDWEDSKKKSKTISFFKKEGYLKGLGFQISPLDSHTYILKSQDKKRALAVLLNTTETHESAEQRFNQLSPVTYAMNKADEENMPWVLMIQDNHIRLYSTKKESGLSHSSRTETYIECQPSLLQEENLGYLWLIFSSEALSEEGSLTEILENSKRFSEDVAKNLKSRIYDKIVPQIAKGIFHARNLNNPSPEELDEIYQMTLIVLFRLLFIAYAEDKDLLPYNTNSTYRSRSLKQKAQELSELFLKGKDINEDDNHWEETAKLWKAIDKGNTEWGIMAYNGGLFSSEQTISKTGYELSKVSVPNKFFVPALKNLLLMETQETPLGPVDFRFLGPREFGTIYEGLLESNLSIADTDLTPNNKNVYVPVKKSKVSEKKKFQKIIVKKGSVYLHNQSGARKATGSYYTKNFVVEHTLDKSLEPALKEHFNRLNKLHDKEAEKEFFNFFTADIAMGSGHFLVATVDRIEKGMSDYLNNRPLKSVQSILNKTKSTAEENLKNISDDYFPVENRKYLARHIARHCIYGVDNNELAVQLAKLSLWTHTFIPGLPLSYFNHNLRCGNSLIGIGTIEEIQSDFVDKKDIENLPLKLIDTNKLIGQAKKPLQYMRTLSDLSIEEVKQSRQLQKEIESSLEHTKALFDVTLFNRIKNKGDIHKIEGWILKWIQDKKSIHSSRELKEARSELKSIKTFHFPIAFPEVFLRERPGFDVILGNPPWEQVNIEKHAFWARYFPGLRGLSQNERETKYKRLEMKYPNLVKQHESEASVINRENAILKSVSYKNLGSGKSDFYKFFSWRFWHLICEKNGFIGVVLPRSLLFSKGSEFYRRELFNKASSDITMLINNEKWVFSEVHAQYIIALVSIQRGNFEKKNIKLFGPYNSIESFNRKRKSHGFVFTKDDLLSWTDSASLPRLPMTESLDVFLQFRKFPQLDLNDEKSWRARPYQEMNATKQKSLMDFKSKEYSKRFWPVYTGKSFNIWEQNTEKYYAYADSELVKEWLYKKRLNGHKNKNSAHSEFSVAYIRDRTSLPCSNARIAFHDVTNSIDYRTVKICLLPKKMFLVHQAPYLLFSRGDKKDEAFLLGILSSIPLDWYARRFVGTHLSFFILNAFPIPRPSRENPLWKRVVALSGRLASSDKRFAKWAEAVGVKYGKLDEKEKNNMIYELDAVVAHLYELSEKQLIHIFETFHKTPEYYEARLKAVLKYYTSWKKSKTAS